jgi:hypothetical protein
MKPVGAVVLLVPDIILVMQPEKKNYFYNLHNFFYLLINISFKLYRLINIL